MRHFVSCANGTSITRAVYIGNKRLATELLATVRILKSHPVRDANFDGDCGMRFTNFLANYSLSVETFVEYSNREVEALNAMDVTEF